jgi:hypothetical protein
MYAMSQASLEQATLAERIRRFAFQNYVAPMREARDAEIRIRAGDVHKAMRLSSRMPAVCGALDSIIFCRECGLELVRRTGPAQGANVEFVFIITRPEAAPVRRSPTALHGPVMPRTRLRFTLRGRTFEKEVYDFIGAVFEKAPGRIRRYSTTINGQRYPIRQVVSCATGLAPIAITSQDAYRILEKFGFAIESHEDTTAPSGRQPPAEANAEAPPVEPRAARVQEHPVSMKIELPREIEAGLAVRAAAEGISLPEYVARLLLEQIAPDTTGTLSPAERAAAWREAATGLPRTPPLSDEAISRESIYADLG